MLHFSYRQPSSLTTPDAAGAAAGTLVCALPLLWRGLSTVRVQPVQPRGYTRVRVTPMLGADIPWQRLTAQATPSVGALLRLAVLVRAEGALLSEMKDQAPPGAGLRSAPPNQRPATGTGRRNSSLATKTVGQRLPDRAAATLAPEVVSSSPTERIAPTATTSVHRGRDDHRVGPGRSSAVRRRRDPH